MGPLTLADFVGLDTLVAISVMADAYGEERFAAPETLQEMVSAEDFRPQVRQGVLRLLRRSTSPMDSGTWRYRTRPGERRQVDQTSLDRIRNATFRPRGADTLKHEVEKFLARLADVGPEPVTVPLRLAVKRELERVGQGRARSSPSRDSAADPRRGRGGGSRPSWWWNQERERTRSNASCSSETRGSADVYAKETRDAAEKDANATA